MADKIVVLNAGRIEQYGSPLELYEHPANLFVAGFIGSPKMNLVSGEAATTSWPPWRRMATVFEPIRPVPPITTIFMVDPPLSMTGDA